MVVLFDAFSDAFFWCFFVASACCIPVPGPLDLLYSARPRAEVGGDFGKEKAPKGAFFYTFTENHKAALLLEFVRIPWNSVEFRGILLNSTVMPGEQGFWPERHNTEVISGLFRCLWHRNGHLGSFTEINEALPASHDESRAGPGTAPSPEISRPGSPLLAP